jgi:Tfp pilus assembly protein PilX
MVTGAVVAFIAATLMRMALLRQQMASHGANMVAEKRADSAGLAALIGHWANVNRTCADPVADGVGPTVNYTCAPAGGAIPGGCGCTCTPIVQTAPPTLPTVTTAGTADSCALTITSVNMP